MDVLPLVNTSASQGNGPDHQAQIPQVEREREREREREKVQWSSGLWTL